MGSKTQVANIAYGRIGSALQLSNVETDRSRQAIIARTFLDDDIAYVLRDFPWPWATAYADLALVGGTASTPVNGDWQYSYRYPSQCAFFRRIVVAGLGRNNPNPPAFRIGRDAQGRLIYTNQELAGGKYTAVITGIEEFDPMAFSMLAWKLGAGLAPSQSRIKGMAEQCMQMYEIEKTKAQSRALNESQQEQPIESEFTRARD